MSAAIVVIGLVMNTMRVVSSTHTLDESTRAARKKEIIIIMMRMMPGMGHSHNKRWCEKRKKTSCFIFSMKLRPFNILSLCLTTSSSHIMRAITYVIIIVVVSLLREKRETTTKTTLSHLTLFFLKVHWLLPGQFNFFSHTSSPSMSQFAPSSSTVQGTAEELAFRAHFALTNGIIMANGDEDNSVLPAPFSLHPFQYPTAAFDTGVKMAPLFNSLGKSNNARN